MAIVFSVFISFILMALFNVQSFIENPFDQKGLDDIKLNEFEIDKSELGEL
jgi:predicted membrane chloride channel (bestrophin family)